MGIEGNEKEKICLQKLRPGEDHEFEVGGDLFQASCRRKKNASIRELSYLLTASLDFIWVPPIVTVAS